jgi:hypothetical protein
LGSIIQFHWLGKKILSIHLCQGFLGFFLITELNKAITFGISGNGVYDDFSL